MRTNEILSQHVYTYLEGALNQGYTGNYLEIGVFNGIGTAVIARAFPELIVYAIDPFIEDGNTVAASGQAPGEIMNAQREAYYSNAESNQKLFEMTSEQFAAQLTDQQIKTMNIQWVLIDGDHHLPAVTIDYQLAMKLLGNRAGHIVFDDLLVPDVAAAVENFKQEWANRIVDCAPIANNVACVIHVAAVE